MRLLTAGIPYLLDDSIELDRVTVVIGANASGKSTLLRGIERCLGPNATEAEHIPSEQPTLLVSPDEVDNKSLALAYGSVSGIFYDWESVISDNESHVLNWGGSWNPDIRPSVELTDDEWFAQLPNLMRAGVSLQLFFEIAHRNREADLQSLKGLCRSLEPAFLVAFHLGRVGVKIGVGELRRHSDAFNRLLNDPELDIAGTFLQSIAEVTRDGSKESKSYVWLQDPEEELRHRDDVDHMHGYSPLLLSYEQSRDQGLGEAIEKVVAKYLRQVINGLKPGLGDLTQEDLSCADQLAIEEDVSTSEEFAPSAHVDDAVDYSSQPVDLPPVKMTPSSLRSLLAQTIPSVTPGKASLQILERLELESWFDGSHLILAQRQGRSGDWQENPLLGFVFGLLEHRANLLSPGFVKQEGAIRIGLEVFGDTQRVTVSFKTSSSDISLDKCSDGIKKYVTLALRLALHQVLRSDFLRCEFRLANEINHHVQYVTKTHERFGGEHVDSQLFGSGETTRLGLPEPHLRLSINADNGDIVEDVLEVTFVENPVRPVLLLDEPENHLHPRACQSVRSWIEELSSRFMLIVVATHNPAIMEVSSDSARVLVAEKKVDGARISDKYHNAMHQRRVLLDQMGITKAELLLMSSYVLFVEGIHDKIALETWFGAELQRAGVMVFPLHGLRNFKHLPDAELIWEVGKTTGMLLDEMDSEIAQDLTRKVDKDSTEYVVRQVLKSWIDAGRVPEVHGLRRKDILFYIDPEAVRHYAREFDTWEDAYGRAVRAGKSSSRQWKRFISDETGVDVSEGGEESIREMCRTALEMELRPAELKVIVDKVIRSATRS